MPQTLKALFFGNSQMFFYDLPGMIQTISESAPPDRPRVAPTKKLVGGATLRTHWESRENLIESGPWDFVVIQDIFNATEPAFSTYAEKFDDLIRRAGSQTLLFASASVTSHYDSNCRFPETTRHLNDIQLAFGKKRVVPVAAAGYAWLRYLGPDPSDSAILDLYAADKGHPGPKGTYLYACLLYACLTGQSPIGLANRFDDIKDGITIPPDEACRMQQAAWEQYLENRAD